MQRKLLCAILSVACLNAAEAPVVKIGVQIPISGERASVGRLMMNGLQMALDKVNESGPKFELVWADDESSPDVAVTALDGLAANPQVIAVIGEINSPFVMASVPSVNKAELPYITAGSSPRTTAASPWIFRVGASDNLLTSVLTGYLVDELKLKSVAIVHDKTGIHNQRADMMAAALKEKYKIEPLANEGWASGAKDFSAQLEKIKASHAEAVIALGETPDGGPLLKQLKASGMQTQVIAQRDFGIKRVFDEAAGGAEGAVVFTEYSPELQGEATRSWSAAFKKRFNNDANVIAAQYYDALMLIAEAMKSGGASRGGIKSGLEHVKAYPGVVADYTFDAARNGIHRFYVAKVSAGKLALIKILAE